MTNQAIKILDKEVWVPEELVSLLHDGQKLAVNLRDGCVEITEIYLKDDSVSLSTKKETDDNREQKNDILSKSHKKQKVALLTQEDVNKLIKDVNDLINGVEIENSRPNREASSQNVDNPILLQNEVDELLAYIQKGIEAQTQEIAQSVISKFKAAIDDHMEK